MQHIGFYKLIDRRDAIRLCVVVKIQSPSQKMGSAVCDIKIEIGGRISLNAEYQSFGLGIQKLGGPFNNIIRLLDVFVNQFTGVVDQAIEQVPRIKLIIG